MSPDMSGGVLHIREHEGCATDCRDQQDPRPHTQPCLTVHVAAAGRTNSSVASCSLHFKQGVMYLRITKDSSKQ